MLRSIFQSGFSSAGRGAEPKEAPLPPGPEQVISSRTGTSPFAAAYMTTRGDAEGPLGTVFPVDGPLGYFAVATAGLAIAGAPSAILVPKLGFTKGYGLGVLISGAILTAIWYARKPKTSETNKDAFSVSVQVPQTRGVG